jgi:hypothetical protein
LTTNRSLEYLDLSQNHICDEGVLAIAQVLPSHSQLAHLDLSDNGFGEKGTVALQEVLTCHYDARITEIYAAYDCVCAANGEILEGVRASKLNFYIRGASVFVLKNSKPFFGCQGTILDVHENGYDIQLSGTGEILQCVSANNIVTIPGRGSAAQYSSELQIAMLLKEREGTDVKQDDNTTMVQFLKGVCIPRNLVKILLREDTRTLFETDRPVAGSHAAVYKCPPDHAFVTGVSGKSCVNIQLLDSGEIKMNVPKSHLVLISREDGRQDDIVVDSDVLYYDPANMDGEGIITKVDNETMNVHVRIPTGIFASVDSYTETLGVDDIAYTFKGDASHIVKASCPRTVRVLGVTRRFGVHFVRWPAWLTTIDDMVVSDDLDFDVLGKHINTDDPNTLSMGQIVPVRWQDSSALCSNVKALLLSGNQLEVPDHPTLTVLQDFLRVIVEAGNVEHLALNRMQIGDENILSLSSLLSRKHNTRALKVLELRRCGISNDGTRSLLAMSTINQTLTSLHIAGNHIDWQLSMPLDAAWKDESNEKCEMLNKIRDDSLYMHSREISVGTYRMGTVLSILESPDILEPMITVQFIDDTSVVTVPLSHMYEDVQELDMVEEHVQHLRLESIRPGYKVRVHMETPVGKAKFAHLVLASLAHTGRSYTDLRNVFSCEESFGDSSPIQRLCTYEADNESRFGSLKPLCRLISMPESDISKLCNEVEKEINDVTTRAGRSILRQTLFSTIKKSQLHDIGCNWAVGQMIVALARALPDSKKANGKIRNIILPLVTRGSIRNINHLSLAISKIRDCVWQVANDVLADSVCDRKYFEEDVLKKKCAIFVNPEPKPNYMQLSGFVEKELNSSGFKRGALFDVPVALKRVCKLPSVTTAGNIQIPGKCWVRAEALRKCFMSKTPLTRAHSGYFLAVWISSLTGPLSTEYAGLTSEDHEMLANFLSRIPLNMLDKRKLVYY